MRGPVGLELDCQAVTGVLMFGCNDNGIHFRYLKIENNGLVYDTS